MSRIAPARGLHSINDVNVIVAKDLIAELELRYGAEDDEYHSDVGILDGGTPHSAIGYLLAEAEEIDGLWFVMLDRGLEWKKLA